MSYYKVSNLTFNDKNMTVTTRVASSNVYPITYDTVKVICKNDNEYNDTINNYVDNIINGTIQFNKSCYKWRYIVNKVKKYMYEKYNLTDTDSLIRYKFMMTKRDEFKDLLLKLSKEKSKKAYLIVNGSPARLKGRRLLRYSNESPYVDDYYKLLDDKKRLEDNNYSVSVVIL